MIEKYKILILEYLLDAKDKVTVVKIPLLYDTPKSVHDTAVTELLNSLYIKNTNSGFKIQPTGEAFLTRYKFGELPKDESFNINIGHHIGGDVQGSDLSINNDLNFSSRPPTNTHPKQSKAVGIFKLILKWIVSNIWQIIIGVIIAYIAYLFGLNKPKH